MMSFLTGLSLRLYLAAHFRKLGFRVDISVSFHTRYRHAEVSTWGTDEVQRSVVNLSICAILTIIK